MNSEIVHACQALTNEFSLIFQQQEYKMRLDLPVTLVNKKNCVPVNEWNGFSFIFFFLIIGWDLPETKCTDI